MKRLTLIGFFCSDCPSFYKTILKYSVTGIFFYSIVDNLKSNLACTVNESKRFFRKYGLSESPTEKISYTSSYSDYIKVVNSLHDEVVNSQMNIQEEGAVIISINILFLINLDHTNRVREDKYRKNRKSHLNFFNQKF